MPISLLHKIANEKLPVMVEGSAGVDCVQILALGGHVIAEVGEPVRTPLGWVSQRAVVKEITHLGRRMLRVSSPTQVHAWRRRVRTCGPVAIGMAAGAMFLTGLGMEFLRRALL